MILEQFFYMNHFLTFFRLEVSVSYLWVDMNERMGSVLLGKWLSLCLHLMYKIHRTNSIGCGHLIALPDFMGYVLVISIDWMWTSMALFALQYRCHVLFQCSY